ncbi:Protein ccc1 [Oleoguttula sp. CCFEE 5521]
MSSSLRDPTPTPSAIASEIEKPLSSTASIDMEAGRRPVHKERHTAHTDLVRDVIIGFSDGLTVPFALTAGLSSLGSSKLVILGGLAELFSGAISMGLGAYLAGVTDKKHYEVERAREVQEVRETPHEEEEEIFELLGRYGVGREASAGVVESLKSNEDMWVKFMMDFELQLTLPASAAWIEGLVMAFSYMFGGFLPMIPYFCFKQVLHALYTSIGITAFILVVFGYVKAIVTGTTKRDAMWSAGQTLVIGAAAAGVSYGIVKGINGVERVQAA